ncbi:MAG: AMP-binding protein, partial [bacterium]|nr:AMP-binding protein [bacterium]
HQGCQFDTLVEKLNIKRDPARNPMFDASFVVQNMDIPEVENDEIRFISHDFEFKTSKFDIFLEASETGDNIIFTTEYCTRLFREESIRRFNRIYIRLLEHVTAGASFENVKTNLAALELLSGEEKTRLLETFNDTAVEYEHEQTIHGLFVQQAERTPDAAAVVCGDLLMTYRCLDEQSDGLARFLAAQCRVAPGSLVGLLMKGNRDFVVALLAVLKAGGAYLPMDPYLPENRLKTIIKDSTLALVLSLKRHIGTLNRLQWECPRFYTYLCMDTRDVHAEEEQEQNTLMDTQLWRHVGEEARDDIGGGGWKSSYTGELLSREEMDEYSENVLLKLQPHLTPNTRILEIGCASGITMFRTAPHVGLYYGTDLSDVIIAENQKRVSRENMSNIKLQTLAAHQIDGVDEKDFDIIIINSVIQCFHGYNYLGKVLKKAVSLIKDKGLLFVGDIMDLDLKKDLVNSLEAFKHAHSQDKYKTKTDLSAELFVSRDYLRDLTVDIPALKAVTFSRKIHTIENELTRYRYDALFKVDKFKVNKFKVDQFKVDKTGAQEDDAQNDIQRDIPGKRVQKHKYQLGIDALHRFDAAENASPLP